MSRKRSHPNKGLGEGNNTAPKQREIFLEGKFRSPFYVEKAKERQAQEEALKARLKGKAHE